MGYSTEVNSNCDTYISGQTSIFKTKYEKNKLPETRLFMRFLCQICATIFFFSDNISVGFCKPEWLTSSNAPATENPKQQSSIL